MRNFRKTVLFCLSLVCASHSLAQQTVAQTDPPSKAASVATASSLSIVVPGRQPLVLTEDDLQKMPQHSVKLKEHGTEVAYTGASLHDLLVRAGAPTGNQLHGRALACYLLASARDGYQAVFTLTEMDPTFTDDELLVVDRVDGNPLSDQQGPLRIIVPHDKKPARSVRMLQKLEVVSLRP